ncbi:MAG TPA: hypothetical protein VMS74_12400 [Acidimicrobiia bacterium]|nr:hypothetical protein [Acidimicrobiia bacterium]
MSESSKTRSGYWVLVLALIGLGFVFIFSIGGLLWFIALVLIVLSPFRSEPQIFRTGLALFLGFGVAFILVSPLTCSLSFESSVLNGESQSSDVVCTSLIGITYMGPDPFTPPLTPALLAGTLLAAIAAPITWLANRPQT